jgi:hypothetical protein
MHRLANTTEPDHSAGTRPANTCRPLYMLGAVRVCIAFFILLVIAPLEPSALFRVIEVSAQSTDSPVLARKTGEDFHRQLKQTVGVRWTEITLRQALDYLPSQWGLAVFLDRRIDPDQLLRFQSDSQSLDGTLQSLAESLDLEVAFLDGVVYFGPPGVPDRLATLAEMKLEEMKQRGGTQNQIFTRREPLQWETLAEPRLLAAELARSAGVAIQNPDELPHDLWEANALPAIPWIHRLTVVLAGFDLTFEISADGTNLQFVPMPADISLVRTYSVPGNIATRLRQLQTAFPDVQLKRAGNRLQVRGTAAEHEGIRRQLESEPGRTAAGNRGGTAARISAAETRYTLRATNRVGVILQAVAQQAQLMVETAPQVEPLLEQVVTLDVKDASLTELLNQLLITQGLAYELKAKRLEVRRAP